MKPPDREIPYRFFGNAVYLVLFNDRKDFELSYECSATLLYFVKKSKYLSLFSLRNFMLDKRQFSADNK
ncbi:MAG TPA: hypothetical protein DC014_01600 [Treponema sp.]|nr:hypothetical protein [Treponema sp.]